MRLRSVYFVLQIFHLLPQNSLGECVCGEALLIGDYVWRESEFYGFEPNITCRKLDTMFSRDNGCPNVGAIREICCVDPVRPRYECANRVRRAVLNDGYDELNSPSSSLLHERLNVTVKMNYQAVTDVNIAVGTVEIFVWLIMSWKDSRLAWSYDADSTCTTFPITARASMGSNSEIWVPQLDLFNRVSGLKDIGDSLAVISNDGEVVWQREGKIKAVCSMTDLGNIPFDNLGCQFMFGSSNEFGIRYLLNPQGALNVGEFTSPYTEYYLTHAQPGVYSSDVPNFEYYFLFFDFYFSRGKNFYIQNVVLPVAIFSVLSICVMILGLGSFQRIALNLTLLLVAVAQKISISNLMPVTDHRLWIVDFVAYSFIWIAITLFQNVLYAVIDAFREDHKKLTEATTVSEDASLHERSCDSSKVDSASMPSGGKHTSLPNWFYTFSLRRFDFISFAVCLTSYIIFLITMMSSKNSWSNVRNSFLWSNSTAD